MRMPEPMAAGSCQFLRRFRVCFEQEDGNFREGRFQYFVNRQWFRCENRLTSDLAESTEMSLSMTTNLTDQRAICLILAYPIYAQSHYIHLRQNSRRYPLDLIALLNFEARAG